MDFEGLWSSESHPYKYPGHSTHWSNIIGGSHNANFMLYRIGSKADKGIQKMAEEGYVGTAERIIKKSGLNLKM